MKHVFFVQIYVYFILTAVFLPVKVQGQALSLEDAIQVGIENNFSIQVAQNLFEQAENNYSFGNAGFLPLVALSASLNESIEDSEFNAGGNQQSTSGARSSSSNVAIDLNWTIFDGLGMFRTYNKLGSLKNLGDMELQMSVENLIANISLAYFNIIRVNEQIKILENNIDVSQERIDIEEAKVDIGSGSEYELLQARSDYNADRAALIRENNFLTDAKISLNRLLSRAPETTFDVSEEMSVNRALEQNQLFQNVMENNIDLSVARLQSEITRLETQEIQSERFPEIAVNTGYSFNRSESGGGFISFNETRGFTYGITARVPIFNGFNLNRRIQNAKINEKNATLLYEESKLQVESDFLALFRAYQNSIELVNLEEQNFEDAEETLDIALERFRLGLISSLEFREAQRTFLEAENRLINARYESKIAETELLRLSGDFSSLL